VTFAPGFRTDVVSIGKACRERNALFLADAAQAVGVLDIDLGELPVDALAVGTPKALLGLYGMGFLFVRNDVANRLKPAYLSGAGIDRNLPSGGSSLKSGAGRFDLGNPNHVGCVAAATSIETLQQIGTAEIEKHAVHLATLLSDGLKEQGLPVLAPGEPRMQTNIVSVGSALEPALDSTSDRRLIGVHAHLSSHRVDLSVRRGVLRFSTHGYTAKADIEQTLDLVSAWRQSA
jgi:selenocysteine lyase/cysteine desulfurase